jgi:short-subunit dehydrogenase
VDLTPGTRALITGASRGIGRSLAHALATRGVTVGLLARDAAQLEALAAELPGAHVVLPCDVRDREAVVAAMDRFVAEAGGLELLVANAGVTHYAPFTTQTPEQVRRMTDINWYGTVWTVQAGLPHLLDRSHGHGHVVIVSSGAALRSFPGAAVYGATKAAQRMFAEALRHELSGTGVFLTTVYPGEIATSLHDHEKDAMPDWYRGGPAAASPDALVARILAAVEQDRRAVHYPPMVRVLGVVHNVAPRVSDRLLRLLRGRTAAPRRD